MEVYLYDCDPTCCDSQESLSFPPHSHPWTQHSGSMTSLVKIISSKSEALLVIDLKCFLPFIVTSALWWDSLVATHGVLAGDPAVVWPTLTSRSHHHHHHHQWWWHLPRPPLHPRKIDTVKTKTNYFYEKNFLQVFSASTRAGCTY